MVIGRAPKFSSPLFTPYGSSLLSSHNKNQVWSKPQFGEMGGVLHPSWKTWTNVCRIVSLCARIWFAYLNLPRIYVPIHVMFPSFIISNTFFIYFCWTWPTRWVNIIEAYPNAASDNDMKGSPLAAFFNVPNTMIFINMYRNCCKADGAEQGIKNSSSKIRTVGLKHKPHIWCNAALLMMWCYKGTCGITRLMSQGQLRYFKSWDWDAAPYE